MITNPCKEIHFDAPAPVRPGVYRALANAYDAWRSTLNDGEKYFDFNVMAEEKFGVEVIYTISPSYFGRRATSVVILDEQKYAAFLLRWL